MKVEPFLQRMEKVGRISFFAGLGGALMAILGGSGLALTPLSDVARSVLASVTLLGLVTLGVGLAVYLVHVGVVLWYVRQHPEPKVDVKE